ncbi:hypothetical protein HYW74_04475 [Candidatus Pacearchaeota archaeon]|nr:hypothetical protein [Candidatus Pacearchaeota archaeon]
MVKSKKDVSKNKEKIKVVKEIKSNIKEVEKKKNNNLEDDIDEEDLDLEKFEEFIMQETPLVSSSAIVRNLPSNQPVEVLERDVGTGFIERNGEDNEDNFKYANVSSQYASGRNNESGTNNINGGYRTIADEGTIPVVDQWDSSRGESLRRRGIGFSNPDFEKMQNYVPAEEQDATKYQSNVNVSNADEEREKLPGERRRKTF